MDRNSSLDDRPVAAWMDIRQATKVLQVTPNAIKDRVRKAGTVRGHAPRSGPNTGPRWIFAWEDIARVAAERGTKCPPVPGSPEPANATAELDAIRAELENVKIGTELARLEASEARESALQSKLTATERERDHLAGQVRQLKTALKSVVDALAADENFESAANRD